MPRLSRGEKAGTPSPGWRDTPSKGALKECKIQHLTYSPLQMAAQFLSAKTGDEWAPELILDRLHTLLSNDCDGLGLETVRVLLPAGWQLQDALTSKQISFSRPTVAEVAQADDFIDQLRAFGDSAAASGRPLAVIIGSKRFHPVDLIPASAVRLLPSDLAALANLPESASIMPFGDLLADIKGGRYPELAKELEAFGAANPHEDKDLHQAPADDDDPPAALIVRHQVEAALPARRNEADSQPVEHGADMELAKLFDPVKVTTLQTIFPDRRWGRYADKASRNGLKSARVGRGIFNLYLAARWWFERKAPAGWTWERCARILANNLPPRSRDSKHLLTGDFD